MSQTMSLSDSSSYSGITIRNIPPVQVFNLPLFEHHLVLDARSADSFQEGSIVSSVSFPAPPVDATDKERELSLVQFIIKLVDECYSPDNASPVVMYGSRDETEAYGVHLSWVARRLGKLKHTKFSIATLPGDYDVGYTAGDNDVQSGLDRLEMFCNTIASRTAELWSIDGGYDAFMTKYPYLCGSIDFSTMLPIPYEVTPYLYLGSRAMDYNLASLATLGGTHLVGASNDRRIHWDELVGISTLRCSVEDDNHQHMLDCWTAATAFISEAVRSNPNARVIVFMWGRSRSASVIMAYLIRGLGYSLEAAREFMQSLCKRVDLTLTYQDQLLTWSKQNYLQN